MIFIERPPVPAFLTVPNNVWTLETQEAIAHYSIPNQNTSFKFTAYKNPEIKNALRGVFGSKCAYCETKYTASSDGDIEHFRPKGLVTGKIPAAPGYYWLSNDWENLLLSCQHCNQARRNKTVGDDGIALIDHKIAKGKLNQFPLTNPLQRVVSHLQNLQAEESLRLLLNPCIDNPEDHFEYDEEFALIKGKTLKATESIEVYVLQRQYLVKNRKEVLTYLLGAIDQAKGLLEIYNETNNSKVKTQFEKSLNILITYTGKESQYSGMCRFFVKKFLNENGLNPKMHTIL